MTIPAGLMRMRMLHADAVQAVREGRRLQKANRANIARCQQENEDLDAMIAEAHASAAMLKRAIRRETRLAYPKPFLAAAE